LKRRSGTGEKKDIELGGKRRGVMGRAGMKDGTCPGGISGEKKGRGSKKTRRGTIRGKLRSERGLGEPNLSGLIFKP